MSLKNKVVNLAKDLVEEARHPTWRAPAYTAAAGGIGATAWTVYENWERIGMYALIGAGVGALYAGGRYAYDQYQRRERR